MDGNHCYALICNIPSIYHSKDLRAFFQDMVERGCFQCFHFRHRPDVRVGIKEKTYCCMVKVKEQYRAELISKYNTTNWSKAVRTKCSIVPIKVSSTPTDNTLDNDKDTDNIGASLCESDITSLVELSPPSVMPMGNVGTPTDHFLQLINQCKLPPKVVKNLGLTFTKSSKRRIYSFVPMDYQTSNERYNTNTDTNIEENYMDAEMADCDNGPDNDNDECEEWERHEAFHHDCGTQDRLDERLYEQEMEVVWEKGGPGLVFYTDSFYWDQMKGTDTDERWADDWDVDVDVYYPDSSNNYRPGDKDAQDMQDIRTNQAREDGSETASVFKKNNKQFKRKRRNSDSELNECAEKFAHFESFSKGVGRRVMEGRGWTEGEGLGASLQGKPLPIALQNEGQTPRSRKGLGFSGEKLQRFGLKKVEKKHLITSIYDDKHVTDPPTSHLRTKELTYLKHS